MAIKAYHVTKRANLDSILSEGLRPKIGPRSELIGESDPQIYLFADKTALEDALCNWLGDAYEDVEEGDLVILEVNVHGLELRNDVPAYEITSKNIIEPDRIVRVLGEDLQPIQVKRPKVNQEESFAP